MKNLKSISLVIVGLFIQLFAQAQEVEMADKLRADGKIWVVVACVLIILTGLFVYLITLDKRLKSLEEK